MGSGSIYASSCCFCICKQRDGPQLDFCPRSDTWPQQDFTGPICVVSLWLIWRGGCHARIEPGSPAHMILGTETQKYDQEHYFGCNVLLSIYPALVTPLGAEVWHHWMSVEIVRWVYTQLRVISDASYYKGNKQGNVTKNGQVILDTSWRRVTGAKSARRP